MALEIPVQPNPGVAISDADENTMPLNYFHLVVIVEPDPESYMPLEEDAPKLEFVIQGMSESISDENDPDRIIQYEIQIPDDAPETNYLWLRYDGISYFAPVIRGITIKAAFYLSEYDDLDHFGYYLRGIFPEAKEWRVAVIGAMFEDDVIRIANFIDESGFSATILKRYCLSNSTFINLDNLLEYTDWLRSYQPPEEQDSWLDEYLGDDGLNDEDNGDTDEEI